MAFLGLKLLEPLRLIRRSGFDAVIGEDAIMPTVAGAFDQFQQPQ